MRASAVFTPNRSESTNSSNALKSKNECQEMGRNVKKVSQLRGFSFSSKSEKNLHQVASSDLQESKPSKRIRLARSNSAPAAMTPPPPEVKLSSSGKENGGTPERRVIADDVKMIHSKLKEELDENNKQYQKAIDVLKTQLEPVLND